MISRCGSRDLDRRKPDAGRVVHGLEHVVGQLCGSPRDLFDRFGHKTQLLVGQDDDFSQSHKPWRRFNPLICRGQCAPATVKRSLTMNFEAMR